MHGELAGCGALRALGASSCEIKRLFVRNEFRGKHLGRLMMEKLLQAAKEAGYDDAYFDTLARLEGAVGLYEAMGCERIAPYYDNPLENVIYYRVAL